MTSVGGAPTTMTPKAQEAQMKEPKSPPSQATLDHASATTGRDGAIDSQQRLKHQMPSA
jgi:hypothetical protein